MHLTAESPASDKLVVILQDIMEEPAPRMFWPRVVWSKYEHCQALALVWLSPYPHCLAPGMRRSCQISRSGEDESCSRPAACI